MPTSKFARQVAVAEPRVRLFCFPFAGGSSVMFSGWGEQLKPEIEVWAALPRGRGMRFREKPVETLEAMVEEYLAALKPFLDASFAFYGHSLGGLMAFEMTLRLQAEGLPTPERVFVGATAPPHLGLIHEEIHHLADAEFVAAIQERYGGIPAEVLNEPELLEIFIPPLKADFAAYERYRFEGNDRMICPVTAFAGLDDSGVAPALVEEWERHTEAEFSFATVPGDHFFLSTSRDTVLATIRESLSAVSMMAGSPMASSKPA